MPQAADPTFIGLSPGSLAAHTAPASEENQGTFRGSDGLALVMKNSWGARMLPIKEPRL